MSVNLFSHELAKLSNGIESSHFNSAVSINSVVIDSRKAQGNSLFVAIKGDNHDGHDYVAGVLENPTNFALVNHDYPHQLPNLIRVADTIAALGLLAQGYRQRFKLPLVAITGSNGKTTVKEMLKSVCECAFGREQVLATSGNLNNHLGMPLTLLELNTKHQVAIIEMGMNHSGELDYLSQLAQPTLAAINNVMFAHAGHFKSLTAIAKAKGEIYNGLSPVGIACLNLGSEFSALWQEQLINLGRQIFPYATTASGCYLEAIDDTGGHYVTPAGKLLVKLQVLGKHNYDNALTVIALALNLGCSLADIKSGLEQYSGYKGRLERKRAFNGALIIDDTYNANPDSVLAALAAVAGLAKPLWFIFGDLKELGAREVEFHQQIGQALTKFGVNRLLTIGNLAKSAADCFGGEKIHFESNQDIVKYCTLQLPESATLLIKGSNSMNLAEIAALLSTGGHY